MNLDFVIDQEVKKACKGTSILESDRQAHAMDILK